MRTAAFLVGTALILASAGCHFETEPSQVTPMSRASNLVINEVLTLPATNQNAHSWIELYNPTMDTIDLEGWTLNFTTERMRFFTLNYPDSTGQDTLVRPYAQDSLYGPVDVPFAASVGFAELKPGWFFLFVSDLTKLNLYYNVGPGPGLDPESTPVVATRKRFRGSAGVDTVMFSMYTFFLQQSDQILLKDPSGRVVDVVRYGNYGSPVPDPYPGNISIGAVPEYESIARYAGAYSTGNTASDFYITKSRTLVPIPRYHSQLSKE